MNNLRNHSFYIPLMCSTLGIVSSAVQPPMDSFRKLGMPNINPTEPPTVVAARPVAHPKPYCWGMGCITCVTFRLIQVHCVSKSSGELLVV